MLINKFKKIKNGQYKITLDDNSIMLVHEDLILKYDLLLKKIIDDDIKEKIMADNLIYIAYDMAIKCIAKKLRSRLEMCEYLRKNGIHESIVEKAIDLLVAKNYLNDEKYCELYINDRINLSSDGPKKIKESLSQKGISDSIIYKCIDIYSRELQLDKISKIIDKQLKVNRTKSSIMLKNKMIQYLLNLGYSFDVINEMINKKTIVNDKTIVKKEYEKAYNKLSRKYSGKDLEYRLKQKMFSLGFKDYEEDL